MKGKPHLKELRQLWETATLGVRWVGRLGAGSEDKRIYRQLTPEDRS
jgi:hypothetical protein